MESMELVERRKIEGGRCVVGDKRFWGETVDERF